MAEPLDRGRREAIEIGDKNSPLRILFLHGYTGSQDDFGSLPNTLHTNLGAYIHIPLLSGHASDPRKLLFYELEDYIKEATSIAEEIRPGSNTFIIIGHSFGGQLALLLGTRGKADAIVASVVPFVFRFPGETGWFNWLFSQRDFWPKRLSRIEKEERKGSFYYPVIPSIGLKIVRKLNRMLEEKLHLLSVPTLIIHARHDRLAHLKSIDLIREKAANARIESKVYDNGRHSIFYSNDKEKVEKLIEEFIKSIKEK